MKTHTLLLTTILSAGLALSLPASAQVAGGNNRDVVHDAPGQIVRNTFGYCVRTKWSADSNECQVAPKLAEVPRQIADEDRTVYFEFDKDRILGSEQRKLDNLANTLKSMHDISGVSVVGYADRIGTTGYNERLSEQRAKVVEAYLRKQGYYNTTVAKTRWLGESAPITNCADNLKHSPLIACLQADRRVTVEIKYRDNQSASAAQ